MDGLQKISSGDNPNRVADGVFVFPSQLARGDRSRNPNFSHRTSKVPLSFWRCTSPHHPPVTHNHNAPRRIDRAHRTQGFQPLAGDHGHLLTFRRL